MILSGVILLASILLSHTAENGVSLTLECDGDSRTVDPGRSVEVTLRVTVPHGIRVEMPDLTDRVVGFTVSDYFDGAPVTNKSGEVVQTDHWYLVPKPCEEVYEIRPFVLGDFYTEAVHFGNPPPREPVTGGLELDPKRDLPSFSWALVWKVAVALEAFLLLLAAVWLMLRTLVRKVREYRMSPIERAWVELDRLLKKGLPGRGRYKDFYVELTMVVRRYVERKYGIRAPHLTTEEFLAEIAKSDNQTIDQSNRLSRFLESADLVKFAGVEATPEMSDEATDSARTYLKGNEAASSKPANRGLKNGSVV